MRCHTLTLSIAIPCAIHWAAPLVGYGSVYPGERVQEIIDNVRANESLYDDIEVQMADQYQLIGRKPHVSKAGGNVAHEKATIDKEVRYVSQNGMFRVDVTGRSTTAEHTLSEDRIRMFDGQTTRVFDQKRIGNLIAGRKDDDNFIRPHMLLLRSSLEMVSLSTYLQGHAALVQVPGLNWDPNHTIEVSYQGEAECQGLQCHKLWITTSIRREHHSIPDVRWELWLAEARNYIPVRSVVYVFRVSPTIAYNEGSVTGFREVEPGIWYPAGATRVYYHDMTIEREGRQEALGRYTYDVKSVSLNPHYDISFFRDLTFPPETAVYEVEDGKIVKSYMVGLEGDPALAQRRWLWWILACNIIVLLTIVAAVYARQRRKRRNA